MIKYIIFDLDDTLFNFKATERKAITEIFQFCNIEVTDKLLDDFSVFNDKMFNDFQNGVYTRLEYQLKRFEVFFKPFGVNVDPSVINKMYIERLANGNDLKPNAYETVLSLYNKGYKLYIGSNGMINVQTNRLKLANLYDYFSDLFISSEIGYNKPDIRFFEYVLKKINCKPEECLMVGDRIATDITGAISCGMHCCYYTKQINHVYEYEISDLIELLNVL